MALTLQQYMAEVQDPLRNGLVDMLWQSSEVMKLLYFIPWEGATYPYSKRTGRPGASFRALNTSFAMKPGQYAPDTETLAILGGGAQSDTMMMLVKPTLRENEIAGMMEAAAQAFDRTFFNGNPDVSGQVNAFYGLRARMLARMKILNVAGGGVINPFQVDALLDAVNGPDSEKVLWMNRSTHSHFQQARVILAGGASLGNVGERPADYRGAQIRLVEKDETDTEILGYVEDQYGSPADWNGSAGGTCCSMFCTRLGKSIDEKNVQGILTKKIDVAPTVNLGEYVRDVVQGWIGMGVFGGYSMAMLTGITNVAPTPALRVSLESHAESLRELNDRLRSVDDVALASAADRIARFIATQPTGKVDEKALLNLASQALKEIRNPGTVQEEGLVAAGKDVAAKDVAGKN